MGFEFAVELERSDECECMCATSINEELCKECMEQPSRRVKNECKREMVLMDEEQSQRGETFVLIQPLGRYQRSSDGTTHPPAI